MTRTLPVLIALIALVGCSSLVSEGGSTTIGNPYVSGIATKNGQPLRNAKVYLLDTGFIPLRPDTIVPVFTDSSGRFSARAAHSGIIRLTLVDSGLTSGLVEDLDLCGDTAGLSLKALPFGTIRTTDSSALLAIPGTPFKSAVGLTVPAGIMPELVSLDSTGIVTKIGYDIQVDSGSLVTAAAGFQWRTAANKSEFSVPDSVGFLAAATDSSIAVCGTSAVSYRSGAGVWTQRNFTGTTIHRMTGSGAYYWAASDSGLLQIGSGGVTTFSSANSPLPDNNVLTLGTDSNAILVVTSTDIFLADGTTWDTIPLPSDITGAITALTGFGRDRVLIGTSAGETRFLSGGTWQSIPALAELDTYGKGIIGAEALGDSLLCVANDSEVLLWNSSRNSVDDRLSRVDDNSNRIPVRGISVDRETGELCVLWQGFVAVRSPLGAISTMDSVSLGLLAGKSALGHGRTSGEFILGSSGGLVFIRRD